MITKQFTPKRTVCKVTFQIPAEWAQNEVALVGDFNAWDPTANKLAKKNGAWETTIRLEPGAQAKFRYYIDNSAWANDDAADAYVANEFGTEDSVVTIDA